MPTLNFALVVDGFYMQPEKLSERKWRFTIITFVKNKKVINQTGEVRTTHKQAWADGMKAMKPHIIAHDQRIKQAQKDHPSISHILKSQLIQKR